MDVATGALGSVLRKLLTLLQDEYKMQKGVRRQVQSLVRELDSIHISLWKVAAVPPDMLNEQVKNWAREIIEASYNIEDRIDTWLVSVDGCREPIEETGCRWLRRAKKKMGDLTTSKERARADFASAIEDIMKQLQELNERHRRYRADDIVLRPVTSASSAVDPRLPALYRNERELVGIEEPREELVRLLAQGDADDDKKREVKVVSIVGLAGVGKTTLAKAVYNRLQAQFHCSAFVTVSQNPDLKKVFMDILLDLDEAKYHTGNITAIRMDEKQLIDEIRIFLQNKRYLIVIDDIWSVPDWKIIRCGLPDGGHGGRIITTSRISNVAAKDPEATYILKPLSHVNSEKLFYKRIFGGEGHCPDIKLAEVSDKILKKCGGLPLAIITVASVLASQPREEWSELYKSLGLRHESNRYVDNMRAVLSFSLYYLPVHLRTCLLHLSIFPENCFIEKDFLIWKWVAEGFVHREHGWSVFETGERCFHELVNSSTIQIAEECPNKGRVYGCRVHPVLLSHIRAISSEENFCTVLEDEHHTSPGSSNSRRIGMHSIRNVGHNTVPETNMNIQKVRSFYASPCFIDGMPRFFSFQVLRILALEYCRGMSRHHLEQIGELVHLRYLGLVGAGVLELPEETLGGLRFLQTLDLRETDIEQWPSTISKLEQLMCLCVRRTRIVPEGIGSLSSLEDLRLHHVSGDSVNLATELRRLQSLRVLEIGFEKMDVELEKALMQVLGRFLGLRSLRLMAAANGEQEHHITTIDASDCTLFEGLKFFSTNMPVSFEPGLRSNMPDLEQVELRVRVAQIAASWLSSLVCLRSLQKVTVVLDCRGACATETEEAEETLRRATVVHPNRPELQVTKENGNDEVLLVEQFRFRNPRFEDLRSETEKMQANQQVQVQPDNDSDEIVPAKVAS